MSDKQYNKNNRVNVCVGAKIKMLRQTTGITQEQLSESVELSQNFISQLENGKKSPSIESLVKIANVLDVPVSVFFEVIQDSASTAPPKNNLLDKKMDLLLKNLRRKEKLILIEILSIIKKHNK
ncbi:MAG: helix-turn-helix domain-containing protein [Candidatus Goldiibacteriota bacterium]